MSDDDTSSGSESTDPHRQPAGLTGRLAQQDQGSLADDDLSSVSSRDGSFAGLAEAGHGIGDGLPAGANGGDAAQTVAAARSARLAFLENLFPDDLSDERNAPSGLGQEGAWPDEGSFELHGPPEIRARMQGLYDSSSDDDQPYDLHGPRHDLGPRAPNDAHLVSVLGQHSFLDYPDTRPVAVPDDASEGSRGPGSRGSEAESIYDSSSSEVTSPPDSRLDPRFRDPRGLGQ